MRKRVVQLLDWLAPLWMPPPLFVIHVRSGTPTTTRGVVTSRFLAACAEALRDQGVSSCTIRGYRRGDGVSLRFSAGVPEAARQTVRNLWFAYR
jgi:hypothetical protein